MTLSTDGIEYDILDRAIKAVRTVPGLFCEIGVRRGGSLQIAIDAALNDGQTRTFIAIDPYGNIPYNTGQAVVRYRYDNRMKHETLAALYSYVQDKPVNVLYFPMEDTEFFFRFTDGIPVYDHEKTMEYNFAFAFLDGPHDLPSIRSELRWFSERMQPGAQVVIDNIEYHSAKDLKDLLEFAGGIGFKEVERNNQKLRLIKN